MTPVTEKIAQAKTVDVPSLDELLNASSATPEFRDAARQYERGESTDRITASAGAPPVKVLRTICQLLAAEPGLVVDSVIVEGRSGCSTFTGVVTARADSTDHQFEFEWNCAWKATEVGWKSFFGDPDQQRAARSFGWQCFRKFDRLA